VTQRELDSIPAAGEMEEEKNIQLNVCLIQTFV
jgi:hypothetical protein